MNILSVLLFLSLALVAAIAGLNWAALSQISSIQLGVTEVEAPLGMVMLFLTALITLLFLGWVFWMQGKVLVEARRHAKEIHEQRALADKAEASRFTELRQFLETQYHSSQQDLEARLQALESRLHARMEENTNTTLAHVANLEMQWERWSGRGSSESMADALQSASPAAWPTSTATGFTVDVDSNSPSTDKASWASAPTDPLAGAVPDPEPRGLSRFIGKQGFFRR